MNQDAQPTAHTLIERIRAELMAAADPAKSEPMQAYMKSELPFYGVQAPGVRQVYRRVFAEVPLPSQEAWLEAVMTLWRQATHREERYVAIGLAADRRYRAFLALGALPAIKEMIVTGAWWDYVDDISSRLVALLLRNHPTDIPGVLRTWATGSDLWLRRAAIICQRNFKAETDVKLLRDCILPSIDSREFFLAKGIGWALRDYAKTSPDEVIAFVHDHEDRMAPLAKREALRILRKQGLV